MANPMASSSISPPLNPFRFRSLPKKRRFISSAARRIRSEVYFSVGTQLIPHPNKVDKGGEDAFLVSSYGGGVLAVADGVSGWAEQDINPALFPQEFMTNASDLVMEEKVNDDPLILLKEAHAATSSTGSATVIIAMLEKNGVLKIANVGDCGLRVLREGQVIYSTPAQEHSFDCPYQLSSERITQTYRDAMVDLVELVEGDTIVMGSDGLFDNVFDQEIASIISRFKDVVEAAKALADLASSHSKDANFDSPYSMEARSRGFDVPLWKKVLGKKLIGGKPDDITVIVGRVVSLSSDDKQSEVVCRRFQKVVRLQVLAKVLPELPWTRTYQSRGCQAHLMRKITLNG